MSHDSKAADCGRVRLHSVNPKVSIWGSERSLRKLRGTRVIHSCPRMKVGEAEARYGGRFSYQEGTANIRSQAGIADSQARAQTGEKTESDVLDAHVNHDD